MGTCPSPTLGKQWSHPPLWGNCGAIAHPQTWGSSGTIAHPQPRGSHGAIPLFGEAVEPLPIPNLGEAIAHPKPRGTSGAIAHPQQWGTTDPLLRGSTRTVPDLQRHPYTNEAKERVVPAAN